MNSFFIHPVLGLKTSVAPNDTSLFKMMGENHAMTHCVDGRNISYNRMRNSCAKSVGSALWSNSAISSPVNCQGIFELYDGSNRVVWIVYDGDIYRYDGSRDPAEVADATPTSFASDSLDLYSFIRYGNYMVFSDYGEHTPYCSDFNDANLSKLVSADTEYKGKYLESFQRRIMLANITSGITNYGELSVIWTDVNPIPSSSCTFGTGDPPSNHLYLPVDDEITGIKRMGRNACFVYGENSINRMDYYANYVTPFGFTTMIENQGFVNHHGIVDVGGTHFGFNKNYGFCSYNGGNQITPISDDIEDIVKNIRSSYYGHIVGTAFPFSGEIAWIVPLEGATTPNAILVYDYREQKWSRIDVAARFISLLVLTTDLTWTMAFEDLGYTTWEDFGNLRWADLFTETPKIAFSDVDGDLYYLGSEANATTAATEWDGYRIEPIINLSRNHDKDLLEEIWFDVSEFGDYSVYVYHRGGETVAECDSSEWEALDEISCNNPANAVTYLAKTHRYHQIKWGSDSEKEPFVVNSIEFKFTPQARY
jgi:hypothetical protein